MRSAVLLLAPVVVMLALEPACGEDFTVTQKGHQFTPQDLKVKKGDKIIFVNDDDRTHNVFSASDGNRFDLKAQRPGAKGDIVLENAGVVDVRCAIHPMMKMTITVE